MVVMVNLGHFCITQSSLACTYTCGAYRESKATALNIISGLNQTQLPNDLL